MITNISSQTPQTLTPNRSARTEQPQTVPSEPQDSVEPGLLRKSVGVLAGAGAGACGLVYGGAKGAVEGTKAVPQATVSGFKIGTKMMEPLTRTTGAVVALGLTGVTGVAVAAAATLGPVGGFLLGTAQGAVEKGGPLVKGATQTAARAGVTVGSAVLGAVGGTLGALVGLCTLPTILYPPFGMKVIPQAVRACASGGFSAGTQVGRYVGGAAGGTLGAVGGGIAALGVGVPRGLEVGQAVAQEGFNLVKNLPQTSKEIWTAGQSAGVKVAQGTGGTVGGLAGAATGVVGIGVEAGFQSVQTAAQWGVQGYQAVVGGESKPEG